MKLIHNSDRLVCQFIALLWMVKLCLADISITAPGTGKTFAVTSPISVTWEDDGATPSISALANLKILLCTGPNNAINCLTTITTTVLPSAGKYTANLASYAALGANGPYYFQFYSTATAGGTTTHYSQRFDLTGMTGSLVPTDGGDSVPPSPQIQVVGAAAADVSSLATVPYAKQTGATRLAPMQFQPGTKVTLQSASLRYPTSAVTYFKTNTAKPNILTTLTPSWSYTITQVTNYASPAPDPSVLGFYAASDALASNINARLSRRRWDDL